MEVTGSIKFRGTPEQVSFVQASLPHGIRSVPPTGNMQVLLPGEKVMELKPEEVVALLHHDLMKEYKVPEGSIAWSYEPFERRIYIKTRSGVKRLHGSYPIASPEFRSLLAIVLPSIGVPYPFCQYIVGSDPLYTESPVWVTPLTWKHTMNVAGIELANPVNPVEDVMLLAFLRLVLPDFGLTVNDRGLIVDAETGMIPWKASLFQEAQFGEMTVSAMPEHLAYIRNNLAYTNERVPDGSAVVVVGTERTFMPVGWALAAVRMHLGILQVSDDPMIMQFRYNPFRKKIIGSVAGKVVFQEKLGTKSTGAMAKVLSCILPQLGLGFSDINVKTMPYPSYFQPGNGQLVCSMDDNHFQGFVGNRRFFYAARGLLKGDLHFLYRKVILGK